jgi:lipopolysaccharide export system ATP-binding protein
VSLEVKKVKLLVYLGPNGAGKTTSFYMMVGLVKADNGYIKINGEDVTSLPLKLKSKKRNWISSTRGKSVFRELSVLKRISLLFLRIEIFLSLKEELIRTTD